MLVASASPDESAIGFSVGLQLDWSDFVVWWKPMTFHCSAAGTFPVSLSVTNSDPGCNASDPGGSREHGDCFVHEAASAPART